jgi:polyisoprenoid-binding protein YceI
MSPRRSTLIAALAVALPIAAIAAPDNVAELQGGHYVLDKHHSSLVARVTHMGVSHYTLRFDALDATLDYDPNHPENARVQASVDPASLDVGADYEKQFAQDFLSASKFPKATFTSTAIQPGASLTASTGLGSTPGTASTTTQATTQTTTQGTMTGDLTLMGVTKPVTFNVTFVGSGHEPTPLPLGHRAAGFEATTTIKRSDFGSTYLNNLVGDEVTLTIEAEFEKK